MFFEQKYLEFVSASGFLKFKNNVFYINEVPYCLIVNDLNTKVVFYDYSYKKGEKQKIVAIQLLSMFAIKYPIKLVSLETLIHLIENPKELKSITYV
jgi:hypothetical protein